MRTLMQPMLFAEPMVGLYPFDQDEANRLLERWQHTLGPINRPFHSEAYALMLDQRPIAVAVSTNTMGNSVAGYRRQEVVELGRLCAEPGNTWANRVLLRLWREVCAPRWQCWPVKAAISYSHNAMHRGEIYRTDGWRLVKEDAGSTSDSNHGRPVTDMRSAGKKRLWAWSYESWVHPSPIACAGKPRCCGRRRPRCGCGRKTCWRRRRNSTGTPIGWKLRLRRWRSWPEPRSGSGET